ncbi:hypothetical protein COCNU_scaffold170027G000010 [Cocos nucifera]|nr:hypothetical protein [Cocos nucifera]
MIASGHSVGGAFRAVERRSGQAGHEGVGDLRPDLKIRLNKKIIKIKIETERGVGCHHCVLFSSLTVAIGSRSCAIQATSAISAVPSDRQSIQGGSNKKKGFERDDSYHHRALLLPGHNRRSSTGTGRRRSWRASDASSTSPFHRIS